MRAAYPLYVSADRRRVVRRNDPDARVLLVPAGHPIPPQTARRYGLVDGRIPDPPRKRTRKKTATPSEDDV